MADSDVDRINDAILSPGFFVKVYKGNEHVQEQSRVLSCFILRLAEIQTQFAWIKDQEIFNLFQSHVLGMIMEFIFLL